MSAVHRVTEALGGGSVGEEGGWGERLAVAQTADVNNQGNDGPDQ